MTRLIAFVALGFALSSSSISFGSETYSVFGVQVPIVKRDVRSDIRVLPVEDDFMSFYINKKEVETDPTSSFTTYNETGEQNGYSVFGVWVTLNPKS